MSQTSQVKLKPKRSKALFIVLMAIMAGVEAILIAFGVISVPIVPGVSAFYPATILFVLFPLWFGVYGLGASFIAGIIGPMLTGTPIFMALWLFAPTEVLIGIPALLIGKAFKMDVSLKSKKDWVLWITSLAIAPVPSAVYFITGMNNLGWIPLGSATTIAYIGWCVSDWILLYIFGTMFAKGATKPLKRLGLFIEGWW
jgi:hypothetical protein